MVEHWLHTVRVEGLERQMDSPGRDEFLFFREFKLLHEYRSGGKRYQVFVFGLLIQRYQ